MTAKFERPSHSQRRVVVTGVSAITPVGLNAKKSWEAVLNGQSGVATITQFDVSEQDAKIAGEVKDFNPDLYVNKKDQKKMDRFIHFALACSQMALEDSGLELDDALKEETGCFIGVGIGGLPFIERQHQIMLERGVNRVTPFFIPAVITNLASGQVSIQYGLKGPNYSVTSACASGNHSIGEAVNYIRNGHCKVMLAGGSESTVSPMAIAGFSAMKALSTRNSHPQMASRPWDEDRDGFVLGEGAAMLVLEDMEHAVQRGAKIYAEVTGYGVSSDAHHMTGPAPGGAGAAQAMRMCLRDAMIEAEDVAYINAHGTSTPLGDLVETEAIKAVFKDHAKKLWVSSTKSMVGHTLGAAGAIESFFSVMAIYKNAVPPTINLDRPSEGCDLDYVPAAAREKQIDHVLNNSFGFGGTNACLIFSKFNS